MSSDPDILMHVTRLLFQAAWADDQVQPAERAALLTYARKQGLAMDEVREIERCLKGEAPLPPPDLGLLKAHREQALAAVCSLIGADGRLSPEEESLLDQIRQLLD